MKKWYQENYFSRRNWILSHLEKLKVTPEQALILLLIDYCNEFREAISMESLSQLSNLTVEDVDKTITDLCGLGYLKITGNSRRITYDLSGVFEEKEAIVQLPRDLFATFETEFNRPLSQKETSLLASWAQNYDERTIIKALREAVKYNKISIEYVRKVLENKDGK